ncbi:NTP transferase domain-containing protein [Parapedobacter koreensis]|uniref:CTP:molybdopterin cytidylyltransferase MocA n=1 Tax=Parapedobacter koreensis TaxID=332977 RepID=A0A1H7MPJ8_9SPHI|nr:NTP transferase domain-containing protein [Parapedobacter koreensis]SEL13246.1 CTP:molybdopterin cytidylyltransferase MocA [Parapedobacter koreensis]
MKEIKQIIAAYESAHLQRQRSALATVVHIDGSSYRSPGARMLITEDGRLTGAISGGCLEGDALRKALLVMMEGTPMLVTYDTSEEGGSVLGIGLGCNGIIRVLIEPIADDMEETPISLLKRIVGKRDPSILVTFFTPGNKKSSAQGTYIAVVAGHAHTTDAALPIPYEHINQDIQRVMVGQHTAFIAYESVHEEGGIIACIAYVAPAPALIVAGAGNDVLPLAQLAALLGWDITLIDGRPAYATAGRFPDCQVIISEPDAALKQVVIDDRTAIVLMSHNYAYDKAMLKAVLGSRARYIGILGPIAKRQRMLQELTEESTAIPHTGYASIYGPVGLDIGAETSEEIALAIMAEIQAVFAGRHGGHLRGLTGKIHQRQTLITPSLHAYGILLLAAGESKRMGTPKQQLPYQGRTLLQHAVQAALGVGTEHTVVVLGAAAATMAQQLEGADVTIVANGDYASGMATSIVSGLTHIMMHHPNVSYLLVMLCDQPHVNTAHLQALIHKQQLTGASVTASYYAGRKGVPALFHRSVFSKLLTLTGDTGAKHVIESFGDEVATVAFPQGAVDVDTREAYQQTVSGNIVNLR